jgi:hypothetical protein
MIKIQILIVENERVLALAKRVCKSLFKSSSKF